MSEVDRTLRKIKNVREYCDKTIKESKNLEEVEDAKDLLNLADEAVYFVKEHGKNNIAIESKAFASFLSITEVHNFS